MLGEILVKPGRDRCRRRAARRLERWSGKGGFSHGAKAAPSESRQLPPAAAPATPGSRRQPRPRHATSAALPPGPLHEEAGRGGLDAGDVHGSGKRGQVLKEDVRRCESRGALSPRLLRRLARRRAPRLLQRRRCAAAPGSEPCRMRASVARQRRERAKSAYA